VPIFSDNLDGSVGDLLRNRSGWSRLVGVDEAQIISGFTGGFALATGTTNASSTWHVPTVQPASDDQYVTGLLDSIPKNGVFPLGVRCDVSSALGAGYLARHQTTGVLSLFRRTSSGTLTQIGSASVTASDLANNSVTLKAVGSQITVEFLGATVIGPVVDATATSGSVAILSRGGSLTAQSAINGWESGEVSTSTAIAPNSAAQPQASTSPSVAAKSTISPAAASQSQASTSPVVAAKGTVAPDAGTQAQSATSPALAPNSVASPHSAAQAQASTNPVLTVRGAVSVNPATQAGSATGPSVAAKSGATPASANQQHTATNPALSAASSVSVSPAAQEQAASGPSIALRYSLLIDNVSHSQFATSPTLKAGTVRQAVRVLVFKALPKSVSFRTARKNLSFTAKVGGGTTMQGLPSKLPEEIWLCKLDCSAWVPLGATISAFDAEVVSGAVVVTEASLADANTGTFLVSGGNSHSFSTIRVLATMSDGQVFGETFTVPM
jgi:hypothetical protein